MFVHFADIYFVRLGLIFKLAIFYPFYVMLKDLSFNFFQLGILPIRLSTFDISCSALRVYSNTQKHHLSIFCAYDILHIRYLAISMILWFRYFAGMVFCVLCFTLHILLLDILHIRYFTIQYSSYLIFVYSIFRSPIFVTSRFCDFDICLSIFAADIFGVDIF